jgi:hypothetical protein
MNQQLPQTMNDLALLAIGLGLGFLVSIIAVMTYALWTSARRMQTNLDIFLRSVPALRDSISTSIDKLRGEVSVGLSRIDAEKMYTASLQLQRLVKSLAVQVETMQKAVFAQPSSPALDFSQTGLEEEALDDARLIAEREGRNRWQGASQSAAQPATADGYATSDPLAGLSEAEKQQRVLEYFERKRAAQAGFPYASPSSFASPSSPPATPPAAGAGAYSSLLDEALSRPLPPSPVADFSGLDAEDGAELVDKGELS